MNIYLGNLKLSDIIRAKYLDKITKFLKENDYHYTANCSDIGNRAGNYHIFDIPRAIVMCGSDKVRYFMEFLINEDIVEDGFIGQVQLLIEELKEN